jgi:hypothetical protein
MSSPTRKHRSYDVQKGEQPMSRLLQTGDPLPAKPPVVPPTAATNPPSPTQPTLTHPRQMHTSNPGPASAPVVPAGAAFPSAQRSHPPSPPPSSPGATPGLNYAALRGLSSKYRMSRK